MGSHGLALRDTGTGVLETLHYRTPNLAGFRLRAEISSVAGLRVLAARRPA